MTLWLRALRAAKKDAMQRFLALMIVAAAAAACQSTPRYGFPCCLRACDAGLCDNLVELRPGQPRPYRVLPTHFV